MTEESPQTAEAERFEYSIADVRKWQENKELLQFVKPFLNRLTLVKAKKLIHYIVYIKEFKCSDIQDNGKSFFHHNQKFFDSNESKTDGIIKISHLKEMRRKFLRKVGELYMARKYFSEGDDTSKNLVTDEGKVYVNKMVNFETVRKVLCDEVGDVEFAYDFEKPDLPIVEILDTANLIHTKIQIVSKGVGFDYPLVYRYMCTACEAETHKKAYEVVSTNTAINCPHIVTYTTSNGDVKTKECKTKLYPDREVTDIKPAFYFDISYDREDEKEVAQAIAFKDYKPGFYECVMYKLSKPGSTNLFMIVDVKKIPPNKIKLPEQTKEENYVFSLVKAFDNFICEQTGVKIFGLYPIKVGLIMQSMLHILKERLLFNVMVVGDPSTGKSLLLKYYSFLLYNYYNMSTNGLSVSVAGLRGTRSSVTLFNKEIRIVTIGHLGTKRSIHIDEAGENKELVQNLKSFLLEDNYSYDRAGSVGVSHKRTSHVNLSQNLDYEHVGQYRGAIRKTYKDMEIIIEGTTKEEWSEDWDLFLPLHKYTNPYLRKIVKEKRLEYKYKQVWWIDNMDYALHERFPFYFYLVNEEENEELKEVVRHNTSIQMISENLELIRALYNEDIIKFYEECISYQYSKNDVEAFQAVDDIIKEYGLKFDSRMLTFYYMVVRLSRVINKREEYWQMDYDLVRWFLETTNIKLEVANTNKFSIEGPPDLLKQKQLDSIEEEAKPFDDQFGLPQGEF